MLFSSIAQCYECMNCTQKYATQIPTSFFPILLVVVVAGSFWGQTVMLVIDVPILAVAIGFVLAFGSFFMIFQLLQIFMTNWVRTKVCPKCGAKLKGIAGGCVDGGIPSLQEIFLYGIMIILPMACYALTDCFL